MADYKINLSLHAETTEIKNAYSELEKIKKTQREIFEIEGATEKERVKYTEQLEQTKQITEKLFDEDIKKQQMLKAEKYLKNSIVVFENAAALAKKRGNTGKYDRWQIIF